MTSVLNDMAEFAFKDGNKKHIDFSGNWAFWCHEPNHMPFFAKNSLQKSVQHLIEFGYFEVGNITVLQTIGMPIGIQQAPFWSQ